MPNNEYPTNLISPSTLGSSNTSFIADHMENEYPPESSLDLIPENFTAQHSVAYILQNLFQQAYQGGYRDENEVVEELTQLFDSESRRELTTICETVVQWSQNLKPRQLKPAVHSLLWLVKLSMSEAEIGMLIDRVHELASLHEDVFGNVVAYVRWLACFFMEAQTEPPNNPFASQGKKVFQIAVDPEWWTVRHDLTTIMLHLNALRDQQIDDNDRFNFQIAISNWESLIDGTGLGSDSANTGQLLGEVTQALFQGRDPLEPNRARLAKSHDNLVGYYSSLAISGAEMKSLIYSIYRATLAELYLTHEQKIEFKRWLLFWNQSMDLTNMIDTVDYQFEEGRSVFSAIDDPVVGECVGSLERFCCS